MGIKVRQGFWDCGLCHKTRIPSYLKECPETYCKEPYNPTLYPEQHYYFPDDAPLLNPNNSDVAKLINGELQLFCDKCGSVIAGDAKACARCGDPVGIDDVRDRRIIYDDLASHYDAEPGPFTPETQLEHAERVMEKGADKELVLEEVTLPTSSRRKVGTKTLEYEAAEVAAEERFQQRLRLNRYPPIIRKLYPHRRPIFVTVGIFVVVAVLTLAVVGINYLMATRDGTVTITALRWERSVEIERYQTMQHEGWAVPFGGRQIGVRPKQSDTERKYLGTTPSVTTSYSTKTTTVTKAVDCSWYEQKNGVEIEHERSCETKAPEYERIPITGTTQVEIWTQVPVYSPWYTYLIDEWVYDRRLQSSGDKSKPMQWPGLNGIATNSIPGDQLGEERAGDRDEFYVIEFTDENGQHHSERGRTDNVWQRLHAGDAVKAKYRVHSDAFVNVEWESVTQSTS